MSNIYNWGIPDQSRRYDFIYTYTGNSQFTLKYVGNRLNNRKKAEQFNLKRVKRTLALTIGTIMLVSTVCGIKNHINNENTNNYNTESTIVTEYIPIPIQIPKNKYDRIEDIANSFYNDEIYNNTFGDKTNYIEYLKRIVQNSNEYINATIMVDINDNRRNDLDSLLFQMSQEEKWINYTVEYGDSIWYYREAAAINGIRNVDDTLNELIKINNWKNIPKLKVGDQIIIYNPKLVSLEREYYNTVNSLINNYKLETDKTK